MRRLVLALLFAVSAGPALPDVFPDYLVIRDRFSPRDIGGGRQREVGLLARIVDETGATVFEELHCGVAVSGLDAEVELSLGTVDPAANPLDLRFQMPWSIVILQCAEDACDGGVPLDASLCGGQPLLDKPLQVVAYAWRAKHASEADRARYAEDCDRLDGLDSRDFMPAGADDWVDEDGDTMTGPLVLPGDPTADMQAATKKYVDDQIRAAIPRGYAILGPTLISPPGFSAPGELLWPAARVDRLSDVPAGGIAQAATVGSTLYVWSAEGRDILSAWTGGAWSMLNTPPIDTPGGMAAVGGKLHLLSQEPGHWSYEPATDTWERLAPAPGPPGVNPLVGALDGVLYAMFNEDHSTHAFVASFSRYDPGADAWISLPVVPRDIMGRALAGFDGRVWSLGARRSATSSSREGNREAWQYDPAGVRWTMGPRLNVFSEQWEGFTLRATVAGDCLWVLSGGGGGNAGPGWSGGEQSARFDSIGVGETSWQEAPSSIMAPRSRPGVATLDGRIHVVGGVLGWNDDDSASDHEAYTPSRPWYLHVKD